MLKALSYMCLDNYDRAAEVARDISIKSKHRFRVETWAEVRKEPSVRQAGCMDGAPCDTRPHVPLPAPGRCRLPC
jgi:hypothetical protein